MMDPEKIAAELSELKTTMRFFDATMQRVERKVDSLDTKMDGILPVCAEHGRQIDLLEALRQEAPKKQPLIVPATLWTGVGTAFATAIYTIFNLWQKSTGSH